MTDKYIRPGAFPAPRLPDYAGLARADGDIWPPDMDAPGGVALQSWESGDPKIWQLYKRAVADRYDLFRDVDWDLLDPDAFTHEQKIAIAYWFALDGIFEQAGTTVFAHAMIAAYEGKENDGLRRMLLSITQDEGNHDLIAKLVCEKLLPGFPYDYTPTCDLGWAAMRNMAWARESIDRFWAGFKSAFEKYGFQILLSSFASGEAVGTLMYTGLSKQSKHPVFKTVMGYMARDESRHYQTATHFIRRYMPFMSEDEKTAVVRNLGSSYAYFSLFMASRPSPRFWEHLPNSWRRWHQVLENLAREAGLGVPTDSEKDDHWRKGLLRVKGLTDEYGAPFPAIEELGIDGDARPLTVDDVLIVGF